MVLVGLLDPRYRSPVDANHGIGGLALLGALPELSDDLADIDHARLAARNLHSVRAMLQLGVDQKGRHADPVGVLARIKQSDAFVIGRALQSTRRPPTLRYRVDEAPAADSVDPGVPASSEEVPVPSPSEHTHPPIPDPFDDAEALETLEEEGGYRCFRQTHHPVRAGLGRSGDRAADPGQG